MAGVFAAVLVVLSTDVVRVTATPVTSAQSTFRVQVVGVTVYQAAIAPNEFRQRSRWWLTGLGVALMVPFALAGYLLGSRLAAELASRPGRPGG